MTWPVWVSPVASLLGVLIGGVITIRGQQALEKRREGRDDAKSEAAADAERRARWRTLQVETIVALQDQMESLARAIAVDTLPIPKRRLMTPAASADARETLMPVGQVVSLCTRLDAQDLADDIRAWLSDMRSAMQANDMGVLAGELKERRLELQGELGIALKQHHPR